FLLIITSTLWLITFLFQCDSELAVCHMPAFRKQDSEAGLILRIEFSWRPKFKKSRRVRDSSGVISCSFLKYCAEQVQFRSSNASTSGLAARMRRCPSQISSESTA
ncbi:uncharacterized, partial [Tachysurus ichikawai]